MENLDNKTNVETPRTIKQAFDNLEGVVIKARDVEILSQLVKDNFDLTVREKDDKPKDLGLKEIVATTPNIIGVIDNMTDEIRSHLECTRKNLNYLQKRLK